MGCKVLTDRIGKKLETVTGAKIHHSVSVDLYENLQDTNQVMVIDFGKDETELAYVQLWRCPSGGSRVVGKRLSWPVNVLEQKEPSDFKEFAAALPQTPPKLMNLIRQKAKEAHFVLVG